MSHLWIPPIASVPPSRPSHAAIRSTSPFSSTRAAVPTRIEEAADPPRAVAAHDDRLLTHARRQIVTRPRDLALVADEEPGAREDPLELLPVDLFVHEDLPADDPTLDVDQTLEATRLCAGHACPPRRFRGCRLANTLAKPW